MVVVDCGGGDPAGQTLAALLMAEVNVHFSYPLLTHPRGFAALALHVDDTDCASSVLLGEGFSFSVRPIFPAS